MQDPAAEPEARGATRWQLRLLGALELVDARGHASRLPSRASALLLARLALAPGRQHGREELADLLWPGATAEVGRNRLRQALSVLRTLLDPPGQALQPTLQADRRAVWLSRGVLACDVEHFRQALAAQDAALALRCYQGELLPGYFDDWVLDERRHLAARADSLRALAAPSVALSAPTLPAPAAPAIDARLPLYLTRPVGQEASLAALAAATLAHRLVVLRAPGGAGKTRLAVEVARALARRAAGPAEGAAAAPFDLLVFVPLAACTSRAQMLDAVLLGLRQQGSADIADAAERVARTLAGRRVLLVLDNFEQLVEAGRDDLARWLSALPLLHLLVTSRRVLGLDGETDQPLPALALPAAGADLQAQAANPAVQLFVDRARAARADFHLTERNHALVADIVRALHGLPLAIELAAARVRSLGLADMLQMLSAPATTGQALSLLARSGARSADDRRHASMLRVLQWSWQQLSAPEQALLAALAVCEGGATLQLLARMQPLSAPAPSVAALAIGVDALVAASVAYLGTTSDTGSGTGSGTAATDADTADTADTEAATRYHAFQPMREFVFLQLGADGLAQQRAAHARAVAQWARGLGREPPLADVHADWRNLVRALASGADPAVPQASAGQAIDTALAARWALDDIVLSPGALDSLRAAADAAPAHHPALLQAVLASHSFDAGQRQAALAHAHAAVQAAAAEPAQRAEVLTLAARVYLRVGEAIERVQALLDEAIVLARQQGDFDTQARALVFCGVLLYRRERNAVSSAVSSAELQRAALALWQRHGPRARATSGLVTYAIGLGRMRNPRRSHAQLPLLDAARTQAAQQGQLGLQAFALSVTGYVLADLRRFAESAASYRRCLQLAWAHNDWREWFYALLNLPRTLAHQRQPQAAARLLGFAQTFYAQRFGELGREDLPEVRRTRRLVAVQVGAVAAHALWLEGAALAMADAMRLALAVTTVA